MGRSAAIWSGAAVGMAVKLCQPRPIERISIILYLGLGWIGLVAVRPFLASLDGATPPCSRAAACSIRWAFSSTSGKIFLSKRHLARIRAGGRRRPLRGRRQPNGGVGEPAARRKDRVRRLHATHHHALQRSIPYHPTLSQY